MPSIAHHFDDNEVPIEKMKTLKGEHRTIYNAGTGYLSSIAHHFDDNEVPLEKK
ncbi:hypothetical protein Q4519_09360 [Motilimonas sp. 1_MG-2023]|uniref:hypothetical protein n=1 Tax=Motilimonas sp. 1_MG-2023 TaxID=3062672 RepID=UPI0026E39613|nr:hypothetical protein [Motilimonas sp. 1_MG-2023]MDO6525884.1 hypothetical protein [Motilimonas sp. 1_MG-2023]